jgi:SAM-dependent methyltransferase
MGMEGSWSGPGGGGYREYFLATMLKEELGLSSFLLFGTGNTDTFERLLGEGFDVVGCDISADVVQYKKARHGHSRFVTPEELSPEPRFDAVIAVEVLEHLAEPRPTVDRLLSMLRPGGVLCGTTNFFSGVSIIDDNSPGYMSLEGHVAYWGEKSLGMLAESRSRKLVSFEMMRPGSVLPDEKYGQLFPTKRVFFVVEPDRVTFFRTLKESTPVLPIDRP